MKPFSKDKAAIRANVSYSENGCWIWAGKIHKHTGYGSLGAVFAHRASWEAFNGKIPVGMDVLHRCDVKQCVNPDHLFLGTHADNMMDMRRKGRDRSSPGTTNPNAKLTEFQALEIFNRPHKRGICVQLSREFGISEQVVGRIRNGKRWKHIHTESLDKAALAKGEQ